MSGRLGFGSRLLRVVIPTRVQVLAVVFLGLCILVAIESTTVLHRIGLSDTALDSSRSQLTERFSGLSHSLLASNLALVAFWSVVGLVAYLICWAGYNLLIEARNEVTLETQYENRGGNAGRLQAIAIKAICGVGLIISFFTFKPALELALGLVAPVIEQITVSTVASAIGGVAVLSLDMYVIFVFLELLLSSWYRSEAFTDLE